MTRQYGDERSKRWTVCLCQEDSDGDGKTNGEELGDPDCVWSVGKTPDVIRGITHPGICDPFKGAECSGKNNWVDCSVEPEMKCDAFKEPDVKNITIHIDKTKVPDKETTYICQAFNLTSMLPEGEAHLIGTKIQLDNKNVMHHALVYACDDNNAETALTRFSSATECGMEIDLCQTPVAVWSIGVDVNCLHKDIGFPIGAQKFKTVLMEIHWNNPEMRDDYTDASGISLFIKTKKRSYDAGVWTIGPAVLYIPPAFPRHVTNGGCSSACTDLMMDQSIYITNLIPHMHYLGTGFVFQQYRNGMKIYELVIDRYMYDDPHVEKSPIEIKPGDDLRIQCIFQSMSRKTFTFFGLSTQEEMCFLMLTYYPVSRSLSPCLTSNGYGFCANRLYPDPSSLCNSTEFYTIAAHDAEVIYQECDGSGLECFTNCKQASERVLKHPCLAEPARDLNLGSFVQSDDGKEFLKRILSCEERPPVPGGSDVTKYPDTCQLTPSVSSVQNVQQSILAVWISLCVASFLN